QTTRGLRIVLVTQGQENDQLAPERLRLAELPVEVLYEDTYSFLAIDPVTPVSRSFQLMPDREPYRVALPLRVLVVVATPSDKPRALADVEVRVMYNALDPLIRAGAVELDFCDPPTCLEFSQRLMDHQY